MLNSVLQAMTAIEVLAPLDAAATANATSLWIDISDFEGDIAVIIATGIVGAGGNIAYTFHTATSNAGAGAALITPVDGALSPVTDGNDPMTQVAVFNANELLGFLRVTGTIGIAGSVLVSYTVVGIPKYSELTETLDYLVEEKAFRENFACRGRPFYGLFDSNALEVLPDIGESRGVEQRAPQITCRSADVTALSIVAGDTVERLTTHDLYRVKYESADGQGVSVLFLRR